MCVGTSALSIVGEMIPPKILRAQYIGLMQVRSNDVCISIGESSASVHRSPSQQRIYTSAASVR